MSHICLAAGRVALLIAAVSVTACGPDEGRTVDPAATYDAYGSPIEPAGAVPAQAVVAEPEIYLGRNVIVEGVATNGCDAPACWTTLDAGNDDRVQIVVAQRGDSIYPFDVPPDVAGRRIIAAGNLHRGTIYETRESEARESPDDLLEAPAETGSDSTLSLLATGVLIEKVRP